MFIEILDKIDIYFTVKSEIMLLLIVWAHI